MPDFLRGGALYKGGSNAVRWMGLGVHCAQDTAVNVGRTDANIAINIT